MERRLFIISSEEIAMSLFARLSVNAKYNLVSSCLLIVLFLALAYNSYSREQSLILKSSIDYARSISHQIVATRDYLSKNVHDEAARNQNLVPQVAATRIASQLTQGSNYYVRQVSLRYRNPDNRPNAYETAQLQSFRDNNKTAETWQVVSEAGKRSMRYLLPMVADQSCLTCHGSYESAPAFVQARFPQGHISYSYKVGEVIGAVSVSVPMQSLYQDVTRNFMRDLLYDGIVLVLFVFTSGWIISRIILTPVKAVATSITRVAKTGNFSERLQRDDNDEIGDLISSFNDLMAELERKTIQRLESEERYRNFIEIAQSPIVTFLADGKILITNQKAEKLLGMNKQELLGQCIFDFMEHGDLLKIEVADYFAGENSQLIETGSRQKVRDVCGRLFDVEMVISVSQSDQNQMFTAILRALKIQ